ncbi:glutamate receptor ionotropic, delta-2-like [Palaemon carinicauda]|uniref:glutamate receptor ionotropic, delta-2-like n=1 Tax=Palaemon carinicauda TaxID=392227 RepID=UPI0035B5C3D5
MMVCWGSASCNLPGNFHTGAKTTSDRNVTVEDVMILMRTILKNSDKILTFLYGQEYEEIADTFPRLAAEEFIVLMDIRNDGKPETLRQMLSLTKRNSFVLLLDTPDNIVSLFQMMRMAILKTHLTRWILLMEGSDAENSVVRLQEFVNEGTQIVIFVKTSDGHMAHFLPYVDLYGVTQFIDKGNWKSTEELKEIVFKDPQQKPYDLSGRKFKMGVKESYLLIKLGRKFPDGSVELLSGMDVAFINMVTSALNITYKAYIPKDDVWGDGLPNGTATGLIGMVAKREVAFGISVLSISDSRLRVVDFTCPYSSGRYVLMSRSPKQKNRALAVLSPFQLQVWVCITSAVLLMGPVVYSIAYLVNKYVANNGEEIDFLWFHFNMFRNIVNQGNLIEDKSFQVRVVLAFWFLFCVINAALYSGMLTATLAIPAYETPIDSLQDLPRATKEGFTIGTLGGSNYEFIFKTATEGIFKDTWNLFNHEDRSKSFVDNANVGVMKVLSEKFVFITSDNFFRAFQTTFGKGRFHVGQQKLLPTFVGIATPKGSPVTGPFDRVILRLAEGGIIDKVIDDHYRRIPAVPSAKQASESTTSASITLTHLQASFYILSMGTLISAATFLVERMTFRHITNE